MKTKKISYKAAEEDIRPLVTNALSYILVRFNKRLVDATSTLEDACTNKDKRDILEAVEGLVDVLSLSIEELENTTSLIAEVPEVKNNLED